MLQTLVVMASIVVLAAAILTSSLVSAKNALHAAVVAKSSTAMTEATSQFTAWAQEFVYKYGTEANWDAKSAQPGPIFYPMCPAKTNCPFNATIQWTVTGATVGPAAKSAANTSQTPSTAQNMAPSVDEQRISATISVTITNSTGREIYGGRTAEITARVFDATPYVVVTAMHDLTASSGIISSSEGDTAGVAPDVGGNSQRNAPDLTAPAAYTDTVLHTTIDCNNTVGFNEDHPFAAADNGSALVDYKYRSGGAQVWAFQLPCTPKNVPSPPANLSNYSPPTNTTYQIGDSNDTTNWAKGDQDGTSFPR